LSEILYSPCPLRFPLSTYYRALLLHYSSTLRSLPFHVQNFTRKIFSIMAGMAFSVAATGFFLYPALRDIIAGNSADNTMVKITLGSTGVQGGDDFGGNIPTVGIYSEDGTLIGRTDGSHKNTWASGSTNSVAVKPNKGMKGTQATYVSVSSGGDDAICIAAVSVAWADGSDPKVWLGDIGKNCSTTRGPYWAPSNTQTGADPQDKSNCIWIGSAGHGGITTQGFGLHIIDFGRTDGLLDQKGQPTTNPVADQWTTNNDLLCKAQARMGFYDTFMGTQYPQVYVPPLQYNADGTDKNPDQVLKGSCDVDPGQHWSCLHTFPTRRRERRQSRPSKRFSRMESTLILSRSPANSAEELCSSPGSVSPDLVSYAEGKYCDMSTRIVWPICTTQITNNCFDTGRNKLIIDEKGLQGRDLDAVAPRRNLEYRDVVHW
jgi:hypothetical protein